MPRTSPLYYIAPSAISIVPNANGRANDLAVMVVKGTKIKLCHPDIPQLRPVGASYQEWTIAGLNRSLANSTVPYTIYARLAKDDKQNGYIVFAPQVPTETEEEGAETTWNDPYVLSPNTSGTSSYGAMDAHGRIKKWDPIPAAQAANGKSNYWWVKLGEVLQPENGERSVMLDTGILGTDLYNADWNLNPDALPFRIELVCSIGDKDVGATPYVGWGKSIKIDAHLVEGWEDAADARVVRWTIARNTGAAEPDQHWNNPQPGEHGRTMPEGSITLTHEHGSGDDFDGAVAVAFTITAWGEVVEDSEAPDAETPTDELLELASITITILAETVESYQLELSSSTVTFNPLTNTYSPNGGVRVRIRAKAQDGEVFYLDDEYIAVAGIQVFYRPVDDDDDDPTELPLVNGQGILPTSLFSSGLSYNLWIENTDGENLDRATVSYLRFGEKGDTPISIFRWYKVGLTPVKPTATNSEEPAPASGDATGSANVYPTDKWSKTAPSRPATGEWALWMCNSIKHGSGIIDAWSQPTRISGDKGENGEDATDREYIYRRLDVFPFSGDLPKNINTGTISGQPSTDKTKDDWVPTGWSDNALPATDSEKYVYMSSREKRPGQSWSAFSDPILWSNWGVQGIDGDGVQYVYKLFDHELTAAERTSNIPSKPDSPTQDGEWIPSGWSDDPLAPTTSMPFCYSSVIKKINGTWGDFCELGLWSKWAEDGKDGAVTPLCRLIPSTLLVPATSDGACLAAFSASVDAEMPIGTSLATVTAATIVSKPSIYVGASASVAQGKAVISVTIAQGVPEANFKGVILVELTGTYLGKTYTAKAGITLGASKQGGQGGQGEQGIQGEQGEDAVSVFLTNEVVILSQATVSPYTIDLTTAFTEAVVIKGTSPQTNFTVAVGSTYHCSASLDDTNTKRVKITAIGQSGGTYYDSGYVIINVTFDGITYQKKYNFYANLLGTWKETVIGDTKTEVAKSLSYGYDGTYTHTLDSMGQYIKSSQENITTLQQTVGDSNGGLVKDVSEIRQTASDISLKVSKSVSANLLPDPIFKNDLGFTGHGGNTSAACAITQFPNSDNGNVENPWMAAGGRLLEVKVTSVTTSGNMWLTPHLAQRVALQAGKKYTFSVWVFLSDESALGYTKNIVELSLWNGNARPSTRPIITYNDKADRTAGKFVQLYKTFEVTAPYTEFTWLPYIHLVASKPITVCFAGAKLEIGESPTDMSFDYSGDVQKNLQEDLLATGIDITHQQIILTANQFFCRNNNGQTTASLDSNGNFTIAGVLNNLIINISSDNVSNYGYSVLGASEWWIDPLHCPSVIKAPAGKIHLPVAYYNAGAQVEARKAGAGASMVLDEMRQCIGKRFWLLLNDDSSNKYQFKIGSGSIPLLVVKRKLINAKDDLFDVATGNEYACSEAAELYNDYTPSAPSSYYLECKCGIYKGYECIYWETCAIGSHL